MDDVADYFAEPRPVPPDDDLHTLAKCPFLPCLGQMASRAGNRYRMRLPQMRQETVVVATISASDTLSFISGVGESGEKKEAESAATTAAE